MSVVRVCAHGKWQASAGVVLHRAAFKTGYEVRIDQCGACRSNGCLKCSFQGNVCVAFADVIPRVPSAGDCFLC